MEAIYYAERTSIVKNFEFLRRNYLNRRRDEISHLRLALVQKNPEKILRFVGKTKGSASMFGFGSIRDLANEMNSQVIGNDWNKLTETFAKYVELIEGLSNRNQH